MHGGKRQGAGRKRGAVSKQSSEIAAKSFGGSISALEFVLAGNRHSILLFKSYA